MAGNYVLPNGSTISRLCGRGCVKKNDKIIVTSAAFSLRGDRDKGCLSVDWIECKHVEECERNIDASLNRLIESGAAKSSQYVTILCALNVRKIIGNDFELDVINDESKNNKCHSLITGLHTDPNSPLNTYLQAQLAKAVDHIEFLKI